MATYDTIIFTNNGKQLINQEIAGELQLSFTRVVFSSDDYTSIADSDVANLTGLKNSEISATAQTFMVNGITKVRGYGYNENINQAFYVKTFALFGQPSNGNETLIAIVNTQVADYMPSFNGKQISQAAYTFSIKIDNTENINFTDTHDITVTTYDLDLAASTANSNAQSLAVSVASSAQSYSQYNYVGELGNSDDVLNLPQNGHYVIRGTNPANNPWNKNIWADVYKTDYNIIIHDNLGQEFIRSYNDSTWKETLNSVNYDYLNSMIDSNSSNAQSLANSVASSAQSYAQYNYIGELGNSDDVLNLPQNGHYVIRGTNPSNNPWNKNIWADVYKTDYNIVIHDNLGEEYIRSYNDSTWKKTLNSINYDYLDSRIDSNASASQSLANSLSSAVSNNFIYTSSTAISLADSLGGYSTWLSSSTNSDANSNASAISALSNNLSNVSNTAYVNQANITNILNSDMPSVTNSLSALNNNKVTDNHDGSIGFNSNTFSLLSSIASNADLFHINNPGMYQSFWGYQNSLFNFPGGNGAAIIIAIGVPGYITKLIVINTWGAEYYSYNNNGSYTAWQQVPQQSDITDLQNQINTIKSKLGM